MNPFLPQVAEVVERLQETESIFTLRVKFRDPELSRSYRFEPGQFNMVYAFGAGDVAISIASDPSDPELLDHTIREVGSITGVLSRLKAGDTLGLRGPFGSSWPLAKAKGMDVLAITGGLGCAPVIGALQYMFKRRDDYGAIKILHGIKAPKDHVFRDKFEEWSRSANTEVLLASDKKARGWKYHIGVVTNLLDEVEVSAARTIAMLCGPEVMMRFAIKGLMEKGIAAEHIYLSMERNMKCALGFCGHCQYGPAFICKDGPILRYDRIQHFFSIREV